MNDSSKTLKVLLSDGVHFWVRAASYKAWNQTRAGAGTIFYDEAQNEVCFVAYGKIIAVIEQAALDGEIERVAPLSQPNEKQEKRRSAGAISAN